MVLWTLSQSVIFLSFFVIVPINWEKTVFRSSIGSNSRQRIFRSLTCFKEFKFPLLIFYRRLVLFIVSQQVPGLINRQHQQIPYPSWSGSQLANNNSQITTPSVQRTGGVQLVSLWLVINPANSPIIVRSTSNIMSCFVQYMERK